MLGAVTGVDDSWAKRQYPLLILTDNALILKCSMVGDSFIHKYLLSMCCVPGIGDPKGKK